MLFKIILIFQNGFFQCGKSMLKWGTLLLHEIMGYQRGTILGQQDCIYLRLVDQDQRLVDQDQRIRGLEAAETEVDAAWRGIKNWETLLELYLGCYLKGQWKNCMGTVGPYIESWKINTELGHCKVGLLEKQKGIRRLISRWRSVNLLGFTILLMNIWVII